MKLIALIFLGASFCSASTVAITTTCDSQTYVTNSCSTAWSQATTSATYTTAPTTLTINASTYALSQGFPQSVLPWPAMNLDQASSYVQISDTFFVPGSGAGYLQVTDVASVPYLDNSDQDPGGLNGHSLVVNGTKTNIPSESLFPQTNVIDIPITLGSTVSFQFTIFSDAEYGGAYANASTDMTLQFFNQQDQVVNLQGTVPEPSTFLLALPLLAIFFVLRRSNG